MKWDHSDLDEKYSALGHWPSQVLDLINKRDNNLERHVNVRNFGIAKTCRQMGWANRHHFEWNKLVLKLL